MKIAMLAPPWYEVPPRGYGGIESLVAQLVDGLSAHGHDVMLVCAGRSGTLARTVHRTLPEAAELLLGDETVAALHSVRAEAAIRDFAPDVVHDHTVAAFTQARHRTCPTVATAHGPLEGPYGELVRSNDHAHVVAISQSQLRSCAEVAWHGVVHNGIRVEAYPYRERKEDFLLFLGRMHPDKGVVQAIEVAERTGRHLVIAARLHGHAEEEFFQHRVRPRLSSSIEYVGEVGYADKVDLLGRAAALLFPLQWREPYGLVVAEAQACGTPVLSLRRGAIPEIVDEGVTAILGDHHDELVAAIDRLGTLSPAACRAFARRNLDISRTVAGYVHVYDSVHAAHRVGVPSTVVDVRTLEDLAVPLTHPTPAGVGIDSPRTGENGRTS